MLLINTPLHDTSKEYDWAEYITRALAISRALHTRPPRAHSHLFLIKYLRGCVWRRFVCSHRYIAYRKLRSAAPRRLEGRPLPSREAGNDEHCVRWLGCPDPLVAQAVVVRRAGRSVVVGGARPAGRAVVVARSSTSVPRRAARSRRAGGHRRRRSRAVVVVVVGMRFGNLNHIVLFVVRNSLPTLYS